MPDDDKPSEYERVALLIEECREERGRCARLRGEILDYRDVLRSSAAAAEVEALKATRAADAAPPPAAG